MERDWGRGCQCLCLGGEYEYLRTTSDQVRRTYVNGELIAEEPLGRVHDWSHAFAVNIHLARLP